MFLRPLARSTWRLSRPVIRQLSSSAIRREPAPFPTIPSCPSPTCSCAETPAMPEGLEIDHSKSLNGTMAAYAEQVLICTGKNDWMSRIEEENSGDNLAADLKELMGRGGVYSDVLLHIPLIHGRVTKNLIAIPQRVPHKRLVPKLRSKEVRSPNNIRLHPALLQIRPFPAARILRFCASTCERLSSS